MYTNRWLSGEKSTAGGEYTRCLLQYNMEKRKWKVKYLPFPFVKIGFRQVK